MRLAIPEEFISQSGSGPDKCDIAIPTVGDLVNRRSLERFPFITVNSDVLSTFDAQECPELSRKCRCMTVDDSVFELQANAIDLRTGRANGHTEVLDLQDIRACCSAYLAGQVMPREELLQNGGMMYQYTKYLTSEASMVDSMQTLLEKYTQADASIAKNVQSQRDMRDLEAASDGLSGVSHESAQLDL